MQNPYFLGLDSGVEDLGRLTLTAPLKTPRLVTDCVLKDDFREILHSLNKRCTSLVILRSYV